MVPYAILVNSVRGTGENMGFYHFEGRQAHLRKMVLGGSNSYRNIISIGHTQASHPAKAGGPEPKGFRRVFGYFLLEQKVPRIGMRNSPSPRQRQTIYR